MTTRSEKPPSTEQLQTVFTALVENGLDFFVRSALELATEQKFAIAHFATGLELVLKGRLFHEHWTLIATEPHKCAWTSVKDGTVRTLQASDLCAAITTTTGTPLGHEKIAFDAVFKHRNRVLHWAPNDDLASTVAEQCLAWYHLRTLLKGPWDDTFTAFNAQIDKVETQLRAHRPYLEVRYDQIKKTLQGLEMTRHLLACPACCFTADVADKGEERVLAFECRVCGYAASGARVSCGALIPLDSFGVYDCECGESHDRAQLLDELDPTPSPGTKEMWGHEPDRGYCGQYFDCEPTVASDCDTYVCVACGVRFEPLELTRCGHCNFRWFGWNSEFSYLTGCEFCEGLDTDDD